MSNPCSMLGITIMTSTPISPIIPPKIVFFLSLSFKNKKPKSIMKRGADEAMMGAFILSEYSSPRKKNEMLMVIPVQAIITSAKKSLG